jgi:HlyD family secretion protein
LAKTVRDEASVTERQVALHTAQINLGSTDIVSPIDGTVASRNVEIAQTVTERLETPPLFLIAPNLTVMKVDINVTEKEIGEIKLGDKASFTVDAFPNRPFAGEVIQISPSPQSIQNVVTYDVVISAPNPDLLLKPGIRARVRIVVDRRDDVLRAPDQALRYSPAVSKVIKNH